MIYLDHAATTRISPAALSAMQKCVENCWANPSSLHTPGRQASECLQKSRETIAACLGASPKELTFTSGGSESDNQAILSAAHAGAKLGKRHLITSAIEHHAVLHTMEALRLQGFDVTFLPVNPEGIVDPDTLASAIRPDTALVSIMTANNEIGTLQPVQKLGTLCRERHIWFHTDAVQAVGHLPLNVNALPVDLLSLSAHKFHGPRGIGALYVRKGAPIEALILGGAQERGRRAGTENLPAIAGMAAALEESCTQLETKALQVKKLRDRLARTLCEINGVSVNGSMTSRLPGNLNLTISGCEAEMFLLLLDQKGVCASSGSACTSGSLDPSHVLLALGRTPKEARSSLRLTLDISNTEEEIERAGTVITEVIPYLRNTH